MLKPVFGKLETEEKIGNLIIDVGSGASPVTQLLKTKPARKRICVDIAADNVASLDELRIRLNAEKVGQLGTLSFRKAILRACAPLEVNPKTEAKMGRADTIVFSDILNYVDFRQVLNGFAQYLKPGGRIIVFNFPYRGNRLLFSDEGLKDNRQLYAFLEENDFEIEHKAFPKGPGIRPRNQRNSLCWWQESLFQLKRRREESVKDQSDAALMIGASRDLAATLYFLGDFESSGNYATLACEFDR